MLELLINCVGIWQNVCLHVLLVFSAAQYWLRSTMMQTVKPRTYFVSFKGRVQREDSHQVFPGGYVWKLKSLNSHRNDFFNVAEKTTAVLTKPRACVNREVSPTCSDDPTPYGLFGPRGGENLKRFSKVAPELFAHKMVNLTFWTIGIKR